MDRSFNNSIYSFWLLIWCLTLIAAWSVAGGAETPKQTILVMGDSLSDAYRLPENIGWVAQLSTALAPHTQVVNASISGETSAGGALRLPSLLEDHEPDVVIIILGGNDGLRALHPNQLESNLSEMIEMAKKAQATVGLMQIRLPPNLGPAYIERFEGIYPQLAQRYDVLLMPFFLVDFFEEDGMIMDDGIHPTAEAQPLMYESVRPFVDQLLSSSQTNSESNL